MNRFILIFFLAIFPPSYSFSLGENNGDWHTIGTIADSCNFIGDAKLSINFKTVKIKVQNWKWKDTSVPEKKFFKGKFRKNNTDIFISNKGFSYKHILEGNIDDNKIFLTFSSTHKDINNKYGGCSFEFVKD